MSTAQVLGSKIPIRTPLIPKTTLVNGGILAELFGPGCIGCDVSDDVEEFLRYYNNEIDRLEYGLPKDFQTAKLALRFQEDVVDTVKVLRAHTDSKRPSVRSALAQSFPNADEKELNRAIDVTLRLWLKVNVREERFEALADPIRPAWQWNDQVNLRNFLHSLFPEPRWDLTAREGRHDPNFTAAFMVNVCGLKIRWITSLEDHLKFDRKKKTLWVFRDKGFLRLMMRNAESLGPDDKQLIPREIFQETIDSLLLLFPYPDEATEKLLRSQEGRRFDEMPPYRSMRPLGIADFKFWKDRLLELYQEIYQVQSPGWNQLRKDQRNPQQWLAFWLGLIIALLTLFSALTGLVSMIASVYQAWCAAPIVCKCDGLGVGRYEKQNQNTTLR